MRSYPSSDLKQNLGDVLAAASREPVSITKHRKPRYVIMSIEAYEDRLSPSARRSFATRDMPDEHLSLLEEALAAIPGDDTDG